MVVADWSSFGIISSAVITAQMPLPVFLFQLFPQLSWFCAATPGVQMVGVGGGANIGYYSLFRLSHYSELACEI